MTKTYILGGVAALMLLAGGLLLFRAYGPAVIAPAGGEDVSLVNTYWKLMTIDGEDVIMPEGMEREPHMVLHIDDNRLAGYSGCNRFSGTYQVDGSALDFPNGIAATRMACLHGMETERAFSSVLERTRGWSVTGDALTLNDESGNAIATFEQRLMR